MMRRAHRLQPLAPMREQKGSQTQATETQDEKATQGEETKREAKKAAADTLVDDNPFICRGID